MELFRVELPEHEVVWSAARRWTVPASVFRLGGVTADAAIRTYVALAHHRIGIPHFGRLVDQSCRVASAVMEQKPNHKPAK